MSVHDSPELAFEGKSPIGRGDADHRLAAPTIGPATQSLPAADGPSLTRENGLAVEWLNARPVDTAQTLSRNIQLVAKRAIDIVLSSIALVVLLPFFAYAAFSIRRTDGGPVFFRQTRIGLNGKPFYLLKFRSFYVQSCDDSGVSQVGKEDARVMPIGKILRRTSADELPQLLNIIAGHMSIVGPRPHVAGQLEAGRPYDEAVPFYRDRYGMRPGLTGWAQANGLRGSTEEFDAAYARIAHDVAYIQNFSLLLDLRIILQTAHQRNFISQRRLSYRYAVGLVLSSRRSTLKIANVTATTAAGARMKSRSSS